jgi:putative phosphoesterase
MKLLICSDIHGDAIAAERVLSAFSREGAERIILLGDILYHGPRNDLPEGYAPKKVIELLSSVRDKLLCVRGNCDTEVDQMVLNFPILAEYAFIEADGLRIFATHGHKFNTDSLPPISPHDILLHGHTHIPACEKFGNDNYYINPGSCAIPKGGYPRSYILYESRRFTAKSFDGEIIFEKTL